SYLTIGLRRTGSEVERSDPGIFVVENRHLGMDVDRQERATRIAMHQVVDRTPAEWQRIEKLADLGYRDENGLLGFVDVQMSSVVPVGRSAVGIFIKEAVHVAWAASCSLQLEAAVHEVELITRRD